LELATVLLPLLGYFFCMIAVLTAARGMMIGLFNTSTSRVSHYPHPRPVIESNFTATNGEPRLFMAAPETKEKSLTKNIEADSSAPTEKPDAKKASLTPKCSPVSATTMRDTAMRRLAPQRDIAQDWMLSDNPDRSGWVLAVPLPPRHRRPPSAAHIPHISEAAHAR
jgi:hypothetical protein